MTPSRRRGRRGHTVPLTAVTFSFRFGKEHLTGNIDISHNVKNTWAVNSAESNIYVISINLHALLLLG